MAKLGYFAFLASLALVWRRDAAFACAKSREMVAGWTLNRRAASAAVFLPFETILIISTCCCGLSFGRRPPIRPCPRALSRPALVLSRSIARSNSANAPSICIVIRPAGLVVSIASLKLRNPAFALAMCSIMVRTSRKGARGPVELPHYKDIRLSKLVKKSMQFGPIPTAAGSFLAKDPLASCGFEGANLCGGILFVCGDSCVTDKHVAQRYCE